MKKSETIATFHIGRGGRFNNAGHVSFCDLKPISDYIGDLFITRENAHDVGSRIGGRENLRGLFESALEGNVAHLARMSAMGLDLGEEVYMDGVGHLVGLSVAEAKTGIGTINIDHQYDTTYSVYLHDCSESEAKLILEAAHVYFQGEDEDIIREIAGIGIENENV